MVRPPTTSRISLLHQLFISTERIIGSMNFWKRMSANLEQADLPLRTAELFYIQIGTALLFGFITAFILGHRGLIALCGADPGRHGARALRAAQGQEAADACSRASCRRR